MKLFTSIKNFFNPISSVPHRTGTCIVKEWMYAHYGSSTWFIHPQLLTTRQAYELFRYRQFKSTGREFEIDIYA